MTIPHQLVATWAVTALGLLSFASGCIDPKADSGADSAAVEGGGDSSGGDSSGGGSSGGGSDDGEPPDMVGMVAAHNAVRATVGVPDLVWDDALAEIARDWATGLANNGCVMEHDYSSPYGENIYWSSFESTVEQVVTAWASEEAFYDYDSNSCAPGEQCGHYTQLVWDTTERVGCAKVTCPAGGGEIWMCDYDPAGNWVGEKPY